jgi:hypothetical protein
VAHRSLTLAVAALLALPVAAGAADPGLWVKTGTDTVPNAYFQGVASDMSNTLFFVGPDKGIARTSPSLKEAARNADPIPADVAQREGYNHIGDPDWEAVDGGRVLLPLECYRPMVGVDANFCGTGSIGVLDPATLTWEYYVKLDPSVIKKAMWVAASPDGLLWTSAGDDLIAYRSAEVTPANAAPNGPALLPVARLTGAAAGGVTGGVFDGARLLIAGHAGDRFVLRAVDVTTGEIEIPAGIESEGVDLFPGLGGTLHWLDARGLGSLNALWTFHRAGSPLKLSLKGKRPRAGKPATVVATVTSLGIAMRGVTVSVGGKSVRTDIDGKATLKLVFKRASLYRVAATRAGLKRASAQLRVTSR